MRTLSAPTLAALGGRVLSIAQLVHMDFPGLPVALTSANFDIDYAGVTYRGAAGLGTISQIEDSPGEIKGLQFQLSGVPIEYLSLALDDASIVQGTSVVIRLAILGEGTLFDAPIDWTGRLDSMSIEEDGDTCAIVVTAESTAVDLLRGNALTTSNADQQFLYPGDRAFEYVALQNSPIVWPTKQLFMAMR
ncbi:hypothetical protein M0765_026440 [Variovorax sp. S2]|uniref:hypothetical protein n=1 Tax=Variovorax sp. S12S4 TaxID=3029170 RepID=UPI00215B948A|nr:hypothetical protein [Variovorax sp. S12S4]MCR8961138.1 hypothetical protein [Variovorax sp. S12S4]